MITNFPKGGASEKVKLFPNFKLFPNLGGGEGGGLEIWEVFPKNTASLILTASLIQTVGGVPSGPPAPVGLPVR